MTYFAGGAITRRTSYSHYRIDGYPMHCKTPSVTGRHTRPVRQQGAWQFSSAVSFFKHVWST